MNKVLETYLRWFTWDRQKDWSLWLPLAEWWYNTTPLLTIKFTPFEALYGYLPSRMVDYVLSTAQMEVVEANLPSKDHIVAPRKPTKSTREDETICRSKEERSGVRSG